NQADALKEKKETTIRQWRESSKEIVGDVTEDDIAEIVSRQTGVPLEVVKRRDTSSLPRGVKPLRTNLSEFERLQAESVLRGQGVEINQGTGFVLLPHRDEFDTLFDSVI